MGNLLAYSGIATKIRAMEAKLLRPEQFVEIANLGSVPEIAEYLRKNTAYAGALETLTEEQIHRGNIEKVLTQSLYHDYTKIYRFSEPGDYERADQRPENRKIRCRFRLQSPG